MAKSKKNREKYTVTVTATGTTIELIFAFQDILDALHHGDHTRTNERTIKFKHTEVTFKKLNVSGT